MGELERVLGTDKLERPAFPFGGKGGGQRDPSPLWDVWYEEFTPTDRRRLSHFMGGSLTPDTLATWLDVSVDAALRWWRQACELELSTDAVQDADDWEQAQTLGPIDIYGPQELADLLGVQINTIHVWRKRDKADLKGRLPLENMIVSGVPIWLGQRIRDWAYDIGRLEDAAGF